MPLRHNARGANLLRARVHMLRPTREQLARCADDVAVLWDEAQDDPRLLRFLAPFGRPDLGRLSRTFRGASISLVEEQYPVYSTWLATMLARAGAPEPASLEALVEPQWDFSMLAPGLRLASPLDLGARRLRTLVVAGSLEAPVVHVRGQLVVAGDLTAKVVLTDGCLLVGGAVRADVVVCRAGAQPQRSREEPARPLGFQVGREVQCRVFDSARFALSCPLRAEVAVRAAGRPVTPEADERLRELMVPQVLRAGVLEPDEVKARAARGEPLFTR